MVATLPPLNIKIYSQADAAAVYVANRIAALILDKQSKGEAAVLGLATGSTPKKVYRHLVKLHQQAGLSFHNVYTFNLDEYYPIAPTHTNSYVRFMKEQLFDHVNIPEDHIFIPDGTLAPQAIADHCQAYEQKIKDLGGIDLQLLGIGRSGHIGFNEPGATADSTTRLVHLHELTRTDGIPDFGGIENVPTQALTMGVQTISNAKKILLMAWGAHKAPIVKEALEGVVSNAIPASHLQTLQKVEYILDGEAARLLQPTKVFS